MTSISVSRVVRNFLKRPKAASRMSDLGSTTEDAVYRTLTQIWPRWSDVLLIVKPETVVRWHRAGFRLFWRWKSRPSGGRPKISAEVRTLIRRMAMENPNWGAPKIHDEFLKLGFEIAERTVARYLQRARRRGDPARSWLAFLANHREVIVAMDFFTVPTVHFKLLYCVFVIEHGRRKVLHFQRHTSSDLRLGGATIT